MDKLLFVLVCKNICVVFLFTGDMCLEVGVVWSSVSFLGGCCMEYSFSGGCCREWCFVLSWVLYGVVFRSQVGVVWISVSFSGGCCME